MRRSGTLGMLFWASFLLIGAVRGEESASLARILPPETPVYLQTRAPTPDEMKKLVVYRTLEDPRLKALLSLLVGGESSLTSMTLPLGHGVLRINVDMSNPDLDIRVGWLAGKKASSFKIKNRFAFAWCGFVKQPLPVDLVAALEVEGDPAAAISVLRDIIVGAVLGLGRHGGSKDVRAEFTRRKVQGVGVTHGSINGVDFYLVPIGKLVVVATSRERVRAMLARYREPGAASFATSAGYRQLMATAPGNGTPTTAFVVRVPETVAAIRKLNAGAASVAEWGLRLAGLWDLRTLSTVTRVDGAGFSSTTAVRLKKGKRLGLARLFDRAPAAKLAALKFAPKDSVYVACGRFDLGELFEIYSDFEDVIGHPVIQRAFRELFGLDLRRDLVSLVGPEAALIVAPTRGLIPDIGVVLESADAVHLEKTLLAMLKRFEWPAGTGVRTFRMRGANVHTIPLGDRRLAEIPVSPTFGVIDGKLLVALYPVTFQRLATVARGDRPSILKNREFLRLRERVPEQALGVSYLDVARMFELCYDTGVPLLQAMPQYGLGATMHYELPDASVFSRHLYGRIAWREADEGGLYWRSHSSIDTGGAMLAAIGAGAGVFAYFREEESAQRAPRPVQTAALVREHVCESRVRLWARRLRNHRRTHGEYPRSLDQVQSPYDAGASYIVPGTKARYTYLGSARAQKTGILLYGAPNGADKKITVLTRRLAIERVSQQQLNRRLARRRGK